MVITYPYSVQCWILNPIAYFGKLWGSPTYDIMSNGGFQKNGSAYPFNDLIYLDSDGMQHVNETKYEEMGLAYLGAKCTWQMFMAMGCLVHVLLCLVRSIPGSENGVGGSHPSANRTAPRNRLSKKIYMPIWTYFVALGFGAAAMLPMSFVYAMSGFSIKVGYFNELIYGYMIEAKGSSRHPLGQLAYRTISGNVRCDARIVLEDQKIGHYLHLPPRQVIGIQIIANMLALPIIYGVMRWVLATKLECYAPVGPKKLFASDFFRPILWGFLAGALAPVPHVGLASQIPARTLRSLEHNHILCICCGVLRESEHGPVYDVPGWHVYELLPVPVSTGFLE
ncbi:OPT oligopeptide transporter protein-domain-containing protein [Aspergillus fruticulosus]